LVDKLANKMLYHLLKMLMYECPSLKSMNQSKKGKEADLYSAYCQYLDH